MILGKLIMILG